MKVRCLLLTIVVLLLLLLLLLIFILKKEREREREREIYLSFRFLGPLWPCLPLILSRDYLIAITKRELFPNVVPSTLLANLACQYPFFSRWRENMRRCFSRPLVYRISVQTVEKYLASPPRSLIFLHSLPCRFFTIGPSASQTLFRDLFRNLSHLSLAKWHFSRSEQRHVDFLFLQYRLSLWIFLFVCAWRHEQETKLVVMYTFLVHSTRLPKNRKRSCCSYPLCSMCDTFG